MLRRSFFLKQRGGTTFNPIYSLPEVHRSVKYEPDYYQRTPAKDAKRIDGIITKWHFIERCGEIEVDLGEGKAKQVYQIRNAQSFETIMPTSHRKLEGTKVSFTPVLEEDNSNKNTTNNNNTEIAEPKSTEKKINNNNEDDLLPGMRRCAINITIDMTSNKEFFKGRSFYTSTESADEAASLTADPLKKALKEKYETNPPTWGNKDIRAETLFQPGGFLSTGNGPSYSGPKVGGALSKKERRELADGMSLEGNLVRIEPPEGMLLRGEVVAWSALHRSGLIKVFDQKEDDGRDVQYAISNVEAFASAMPTSIVLRGATVQFKPVHMHEVANADAVVKSGGTEKIQLGKVVLSLAENIDVVELPKKPKPESTIIPTQDEEDRMEIEKLKQTSSSSSSSRTKTSMTSSQKNKRWKEWMDEESDRLEAPEGIQYGVITRWSGGQGVIESATGRTFMIDSVKDFSTYFDVSAISVRGAVVEFHVLKDKPKFAATIVILSDMSNASEHGSVVQTHIPLANVPFELSMEDMMISGKQQQQQQKQKQQVANEQQKHQEVTSSTQQQSESVSSEENQNQKQVPENQDDDADIKNDQGKKVGSKKHSTSEVDISSLPVRKGVLVSYSPAEFQGVVKDQETGERFLIRDTRQDIQDFKTMKSKLARGCIMEFRAVGSSGRLATYATISLLPNGEPPLVDEEELDVSENAAGSQEPREEAVAGPASMSYWVTRFEKVGANMKEYKNFNQQAFVPGELPKDESGKQMEEDPRKNDPWFNDSDKNRKIPGTDAKFSDLMQYNQTGMMELSQTARDPQKLQKKMIELEDKVPAEMREQGMQKAREWGPKYLKRIKEGQKAGGDYNFNFSS